ncbi:MAG: bifunctional diaminohydroxyphosphoribosylaminopyrimidine deaminase/5-amino-6-(5-phosphoribosylamino)uracil reductase RibD [Chitinophagales bacterium]
MDRAFELAGLGKPKIRSNPAVGCVIIHNDTIIGEGYHKEFGGPHAEINAISSVKSGDLDKLKEATFYVTLEPCSFIGKTPSCANHLIEMGVKHVVVGSLDPNPKVAGRGVEMMRARRIQVEVLEYSETNANLNPGFYSAMLHGRPYVTLKWAQSKDGFIGQTGQGSMAISGPESRNVTHSWRSQHHAILVGSNTILEDNPRLDVRLVEGESPQVIVLDRRGRLTGNEKIFSLGREVWVFSHAAKEINDHRWITIDSAQPLIPAVFETMMAYEMNTLFVEGGRLIHQAFLEGPMWWDELRYFTSRAVLGHGVSAPDIPADSVPYVREEVGGDEMVILRAKQIWQNFISS